MNANEFGSFPTPTKSIGVKKRGWGFSRTGPLRYSQEKQLSALRFGYRPPEALLEWLMGFDEDWTRGGYEHRACAYGDAVVPQVVKGILELCFDEITENT